MQDTLSTSNTITSNRPTDDNVFVASTGKLNRRMAAKLTAAVLAVIAAGCGTAKVAHRHSVNEVVVSQPRMVYVADFDLEPGDVKSERGLMPTPPKLPGLGDILPPLPGTANDPNKRAQQLVDEMSAALVKDLKKAGLAAQRLVSNAGWPKTGWLVRGVFTSVNPGNQFERAVIGLGKGKTDVQVLVEVNDLAEGVPQKFYEVVITADSGKTPGAGPTIILGPAGLAARFVIAGQDLDRNVRQTASLIADEVVRRTDPASPATLASHR